MTTAQQKIALIFGITGQTGSYLTEILMEKGYVVHGVIRRSSNFNTTRIEHIFPQIRDNLHYGDITDALFVNNIIQRLRPHEVYNLAAQSHVAVSFELPLYTSTVDSLGVLNILEAIKTCGLIAHTKLYQAGTSEMYGGDKNDYSDKEWDSITSYGMDEQTAFHPKSPYAAAKLYAHNMAKIYRESYGIFAVNGICFNHESERRDPRFVTRKVTTGVARIAKGLDEYLVLGDLTSRRDWGHARDYAMGIYISLQHEQPGDYVFATGKTWSVAELVEIAFSVIGITIVWTEKDGAVHGVNKDTDEVLVRTSDKYLRPNEVHYLKGDSSHAKRILRWKPVTDFHTMIRNMVKNDMDEIDSKF